MTDHCAQVHGIPFVSKDNFYTNDRHNTSEGGLVLLGGRYPRESTVITRARQAGMVLLGHAALSEAADHRALSNFSDGYSTRGGQVSIWHLRSQIESLVRLIADARNWHSLDSQSV